MKELTSTGIASPDSGAGALVLVVEDDEAARLTTSITLERAGYQVLEAADCASARERFAERIPDIVLLDVLLPDGDGYSLCREFLAHPRGRDLPIAMVTGLDDINSIHQAYESGATDFITKPVSWGTLPYRIQFILRAKQALNEASISEGKMRALLAGIPDIILRIDRDGHVIDMQVGTYVNEMEEWVVYDPTTGEGHLPGPVYRILAPQIRRVFAGKGEQLVEFEWSQAQKKQRTWEARVILRERDEVVMVIRDITQRKQQEAELRLWAKVFEGSNEAILITDAHLNIILVNKTYEKIMGYTEEEVLGVDTATVGTRLHSHSFFRNLVHILKERGYWQGELINKRKNGEKFPTWYSISQVLNADGQPENYIAIFSDISERKKSRERIDFLAHHDSLTELPNRALLNDRLEMAINTAKRRGEKVGILFIDLDRFKNINDSLGHAAGDQILRQTAARLSAAVRTDDTVARLGGDEFVVLLPRVRDERSLAEVAIKLREELLLPYILEDMPLHLSPSIGIAVYPDDGETPSTLIKNADAAMYLAKEKGRNNYQFYTPVLNARTLDRLKLEYDLRSALEQGQFELHYQPQIVAGSKTLYGAEALLRWRHPERGLVPPNHFIPLAEEIGLIIPLGAWVIAEAARQVNAWHQAGFADLIVSVNISALQFHQAGFLAEVQGLLAQAGTQPSALELELTESMLMSDMEVSIQVLQAFRDLGYRIAIDDFGTGFSCLNYLRRLPVNILKIDQSFVRDMQTDGASLAIVTSIIRLAESLGMETIAEGVETAEEVALLASQGCRLMQGYHFSKPLPPVQFEAWLTQWLAS
ncbi:EAL domain-containing protein [Cellvibrio fibrivorans]|uniref:Diguanylate cyclase (GGDEF)-like protein/PAS domain S-box-containing protein n=1 Tax=Cellvibrio fibrivorans TaxID=126350 RepID=A0ABU1UXS2_9GAMM|nr:EAL domain-containing protein [Cellvibrio fibrivorans]MDR7089997.1 diguanylate cyclase (GGDEF)-like protein/PAS domain S-box-containing protein [Cellvibrio fibrivorans]